jgi:hypothetical protein
MAAFGPTRTEGPAPAISSPLVPAAPAGATDTSAPLEQQRNSCPLSTVGREAGANLRPAFRSVAEGSACGRERRSLFGFASCNEPLVAGSKLQNGSN